LYNNNRNTLPFSRKGLGAARHHCDKHFINADRGNLLSEELEAVSTEEPQLRSLLWEAGTWGKTTAPEGS